MGVSAQRRVAAEQKQPQVLVARIVSIVNHVGHLLVVAAGAAVLTAEAGALCVQHEIGRRPRETSRGGGLAPHPVDRAIARHRVEPGCGVARHYGPVQSLNERILHRIVGNIEAEAVREKSEHMPTLLTRQAGDRL